MNVEEYVDRALSSYRWAWLIHAIVAGGLLLMVLSGWWLLLVPIYLAISYQLGLMYVANKLVNDLPKDALRGEFTAEALAAFHELKSKLEAGEIQPGQELYDLMSTAGLDLALVEKTSETVVGRYQDHDIYEWVEMYDPSTGQVERFFFHEVAGKDEAGNPTFEPVEGKKQALVNGVLYARDVQPARS